VCVCVCVCVVCARQKWVSSADLCDAKQFPAAELDTLCKPITGGTEGYMYDPYEHKLINEYWSCSEKQNSFSYGGVDFHFEKNWYDAAKVTTLECMATTMAQDQFQANWNLFNTNAVYQKKLEFCFFNSKTWDAFDTSGGGSCDCSPSRATFYIHAVNVNTIQKHQMYGCMFASPTADAPIPATYHDCSSTPRHEILYGKYTYKDEEKAAEAKEYGDRGASRRATLIAFFIIKELGPLGGILILPFVGALFAVVFIPAVLLVGIFSRMVSPHERTHFKASLWHLTENLWGEVVNQAFAIFAALSSSYRAYDSLIRVLTSSSMNSSIIKDGIGKVTAVGNVLFNLTLLVLSEISFADGSAIWASVITSTINVVIAILIEREKFKFQAAFYKDLNENRLSKFEIALGLNKILEDFLEEDISFNYVQHLYGTTRVRPQVLDEFEESEKRQPGWFR
jgi:hypothetical protein